MRLHLLHHLHYHLYCFNLYQQHHLTSSSRHTHSLSSAPSLRTYLTAAPLACACSPPVKPALSVCNISRSIAYPPRYTPPAARGPRRIITTGQISSPHPRHPPGAEHAIRYTHRRCCPPLDFLSAFHRTPHPQRRLACDAQLVLLRSSPIHTSAALIRRAAASERPSGLLICASRCCFSTNSLLSATRSMVLMRLSCVTSL